MKHVADSRRFSIVQTNLDECFRCLKVPVEKHEIFYGTAERQKSKDWGMVVALCPECHRKVHRFKEIDRGLKRIGQTIFEKEYGHEKFMDVFHRNYLEGSEDDSL